MASEAHRLIPRQDRRHKIIVHTKRVTSKRWPVPRLRWVNCSGVQRQLHWLDDRRALCSFWHRTLLTSPLLKSERPRSRCNTGSRARFDADDIALGRRENPDERGRDVENLLGSIGYPAPSAATAEEGEHQRPAASILPPPLSSPPAESTACARIRMPGFAAERRKASHSMQSHRSS